MINIHVIDGDAAVRLAARRVLELAGFAVSDAPDDTGGAPSCLGLVIADLAVASLAAIRRRHPAAPILAIGGNLGSLAKPFTPSQLLAAVRLCLARPRFTKPCATTGRRRR